MNAVALICDPDNAPENEPTSTFGFPFLRRPLIEPEYLFPEMLTVTVVPVRLPVVVADPCPPVTGTIIGIGPGQ